MRQIWLWVLVSMVIVVAGFLWWIKPDAESQQPAAKVTKPVAAATIVKQESAIKGMPVVQPPKVQTPIVPLTPEAKKVEKEVQHTPMNRPMNVVIKNWLACQTKDEYNDTALLLEHNSPDAMAAFQGASPQCVMLMQGKSVTVLQKSKDDSMVQIQQEGSAIIWWSSATALAGDVPKD